MLGTASTQKIIVAIAIHIADSERRSILRELVGQRRLSIKIYIIKFGRSKIEAEQCRFQFVQQRASRNNKGWRLFRFSIFYYI